MKNQTIYKWQYEHTYRIGTWEELQDIRFEALPTQMKRGKGCKSFNDIVCMLDTETSKHHKNKLIPDGKLKKGVPKYKYDTVNNYVVAWTLSIRTAGVNICTIYGHRPDECINVLTELKERLRGDELYLYIHNLPYDWVFLRRFMINEWGQPVKQLNVKPHYPINIQFENGIILRDSLILAQRTLEKWADDLDVEHKKAVGSWDYDTIRDQNHVFTDEELHYIENDTLAGVECIDVTRLTLNKTISSIPMTATGIPRDDVQRLGRKVRAKEKFLQQTGDWDFMQVLEKAYHGGYTHANRHLIETDLTENFIKIYSPTAEPVVKGADFSSSYPFAMLSEKFPTEKFTKLEDDVSVDDILAQSDDTAFVFKLLMVGRVKLKDSILPMPPLQFSKCLKIINAVQDNGRILGCDYCELYITEQDLCVIDEYYTADYWLIRDCYAAHKEYLPDWFTDYVYRCYEDKTTLKGEDSDPVLYSLAKAKLNSLYGMCVQKSVKIENVEDYVTGEYGSAEIDWEAEYEKYLINRNKVLPYQWGVWVTAYAFRNLYELGKCFDVWVYSDTDSVYGIGMRQDKIEAYNNKCIERLTAAGYGPVIHNDREYWPGIAEHDELKDTYTEFKVMGAKRYLGRQLKDGKLHLTVAGVPKIGVAALEDDITHFRDGFVFSGLVTGKKLHTYTFVPDVWTDDRGNICADSIDLTPTDYELSRVRVIDDWEELITDEIELGAWDVLH